MRVGAAGPGVTEALEVVWGSSTCSGPGSPTAKGLGHKRPLVSQEAKHMKTTKGLTAGRRMLTEKTGWGEKQDRCGESHTSRLVGFFFSINFLKFI